MRRIIKPQNMPTLPGRKGTAALKNFKAAEIKQVLECRSVIRRLFSFTAARQIISVYYNSLIVAVISILRIRLAGVWTAAMQEAKTSNRIIAIEVTGIFHAPPKWLIMIFA